MICRLALGCVLAVGLVAQTPVARVTQAIQDQVTVRLAGNTMALAAPARDRGAAAPGMPLEHMLLVLKHSDRQEMDLRLLLDQQRTTGAAGYHQWLTPGQFGERFGPAPSDIAAVTQWLTGEGFTVNRVAAGRGEIEFSGTAGNLSSAFHTQLHRYQATDGLHWANAQDPAIPAALAPVVAGIVSLNDVRARPAAHIVGHHSLQPALNFRDGTHAIAPGDFAVIYDTQPLLDAKTDGTGETIAVVARSDINPSDYQQFRTTFLPSGTGPGLKTVEADTDPGVASNGDEVEATLDAEWATGAAPGAQIALVVSGGSTTTDGVDLAALYIVDHDLAGVMNTSFGNCESDLGAAENQFWSNLYEQAAAEGISAFTSAGDNGAAGCDDPSTTTAVHGAAVSGLASTPFNTAVGGTQFDEQGDDLAYWGSPRPDFSSAARYIPEAAWNESAPSGGNPASLFAGSGGVSTIYAKPAWQAGTGVPADSKRDLPDVSLNAAGGHDGYVLCLTQVVQGQVLSCSGGGVFVVGGTSASSPAFAGLAALVDQKMGGRQGLINPVLYQLASKAAVFHDVTAGNTNVPGQIGFAAAPGYDLATGLGSVDAAALANAWGSVSFAATTTTLTLTPPANLVYGQSVPMNLQVGGTGTGGALPTGAVEILAQNTDGSQTAMQTFPLDANGRVTATAIPGLPGGSYNLIARYSGDLNFSASASSAVGVTVGRAAVAADIEIIDGKGQPATSISYGTAAYAHVTVSASSGSGAPSGSVSVMSQAGSAAPTQQATLTLDTAGVATTTTPIQFATGQNSVTANYGGSTDYLPAVSAPISVAVSRSPTTLAISATPDYINILFDTKAQIGFIPIYPLLVFDGTTQIGTTGGGDSGTDSNGFQELNSTFWLGSLPNGALPGTSATITVQFPGDANFLPSVSNAITVPTPPNLAVSPAVLDFGTVPVGGTSATLTATVANSGGTAAQIPLSVQGSGFTLAGTCGPVLAPGASCTYQVTYQPSRPAVDGGAIWLNSNVELTLHAVAPGFQLIPNGGDGRVGQGMAATFPVFLNQVGGFTGPVALSCSGLPPLSACSFSPANPTVSASPTAVTVTVTTTAPTPASLVLPWADWGLGMALMLGLGGLLLEPGQRRRGFRPISVCLLVLATVACGGGGGGSAPPYTPPATPAAPQARLVPSSLAFPAAPAGQASAPQTVTLSNVGNAALSFSGLSLQQPASDPHAFSATSNCSSEIAANTVCAIKVVYTPSAVGTVTGALLVQDDAAGSPQNVALTGIGTITGTPQGSYLVTVTATSGKISVSTVEPLVVY